MICLVCFSLGESKGILKKSFGKALRKEQQKFEPWLRGKYIYTNDFENEISMIHPHIRSLNKFCSAVLYDLSGFVYVKTSNWYQSTSSRNIHII